MNLKKIIFKSNSLSSRNNGNALYIIQKRSIYESLGEFPTARNETYEISCVSRADPENKSIGSRATSFHAKLREERLVNYSVRRQIPNPRNRPEERKNSRRQLRGGKHAQRKEREKEVSSSAFSLRYLLFRLSSPYSRISPYLLPFGHKYVNTTVDDSPRR